MTTAQMCIILAITVYLAAMIGVGVYFSRVGSSSSNDFYLGGRRLGPVVTAMSAEASDMSSYLLMGLPGLAYLCGVAEVGWTVIGLAVGTYLNWLIVAKRLRRYSAATGAITIPDFSPGATAITGISSPVLRPLSFWCSLSPTPRPGSRLWARCSIVFLEWITILP